MNAQTQSTSLINESQLIVIKVLCQLQ